MADPLVEELDKKNNHGDHRAHGDKKLRPCVTYVTLLQREEGLSK